jgi:hypothetical protein
MQISEYFPKMNIEIISTIFTKNHIINHQLEEKIKIYTLTKSLQEYKFQKCKLSCMNRLSVLSFHPDTKEFYTWLNKFCKRPLGDISFDVFAKGKIILFFDHSNINGKIFISKENEIINKIHFNLCMSQAYYYTLWHNNGIILHSSAVIDENSHCYLFLGTSGNGKTTAAKLSGKKIIHDDIIVMRKIDDKFFVSAPPEFIDTKFHSQMKNKMFIPHSLFILKKSDCILFTRIKGVYALAYVFNNIYPSFFQSLFQNYAKDVLLFVSELVKKIKVYEMQFCKDKPFWKELEKL